MNIIEASYTSIRFPYPGGQTRFAGIEDIKQVGKLIAYGDNVTRYVLRLECALDKLYFVKLSMQSDIERKWLEKAGKPIVIDRISREIGYAIFWREIYR